MTGTRSLADAFAVDVVDRVAPDRGGERRPGQQGLKFGLLEKAEQEHRARDFAADRLGQSPGRSVNGAQGTRREAALWRWLRSAAGGYGETTIVPFIHGWMEQ